MFQELILQLRAPPVMYCDIIEAAHLYMHLVMHSRLEHISIDIDFVRYIMVKNLILVSHISAKD